MEITALGHSSFKLKGKAATLVTDPFDPEMVGINFPKNTTADIITVSHTHHDHDFIKQVLPQVENEQIIIKGPGEYEVKGVSITGIETYHDNEQGKNRGKNTIYKIEMDNLVLVHLGDLGHKLSDIQEEILNDVNVLFVPVGGIYTLDAKGGAEIAAQIEPDIIIPMHYKRDNMNQKTFGELAGVDLFLKEMGHEKIEPLSKLKVTRDQLPQETQIVVLE